MASQSSWQRLARSAPLRPFFLRGTARPPLQRPLVTSRPNFGSSPYLRIPARYALQIALPVECQTRSPRSPTQVLPLICSVGREFAPAWLPRKIWLDYRQGWGLNVPAL